MGNRIFFIYFKITLNGIRVCAQSYLKIKSCFFLGSYIYALQFKCVASIGTLIGSIVLHDLRL